jgi:hypothetical protein
VGSAACALTCVLRARETKKKVGARYISSLRPTIFSLVQKAIGNLTNLREKYLVPKLLGKKYKYNLTEMDFWRAINFSILQSWRVALFKKCFHFSF